MPAMGSDADAGFIEVHDPYELTGFPLVEFNHRPNKDWDYICRRFF